MYRQGKYPITQKCAAAKGIFDITVKCPEIAAEAEAGQFAQIAAEGFFLRRPISICDIDRTNGTIRFVFEVRGKGTEKISELNKGDMIDIIAPLGKGFKALGSDKKAVCIGGGIGTPPMLGIAKKYGKRAAVISGFRTSSIAILQEDFKAAGAETILCTDDGSAGVHGFVTDALKSYLKSAKPDIIYACGPMPMLKGIVDIAEKYGIETQVSLEQRMACGVGACLGCVCRTVKDGKEIYSHVCKDGPVFDSKEVDLNG
ncbi:dihydroorotate dehydrogenase electron transfer subunit [Ruminococcus sp. Marseille-P6503]|uniref:dihydroorotate dehydrogenase electron transfer subunit n=1 Tax=Ruminococcus sp. Marseille-P6503 TaxID=2364796 RepID=UPI000F53D2AF|nr:dihydroorotate dehydrogenase electron transfer subunit [Ruminococcus sp. Marseille-P6503]